MRPYSCWCAVVAAVLVAGAVAIPPARARAEPRLTLATSAVVAGQAIVVSGEGWSSRLGEVRLELEDAATGTPFGQPVVSPVLDGGTFSGVTVHLPVATLPGSYLLAACQACGDVDFSLAADHQLTVLAPTLQLDPRSAAAGEQVTASGEGWNPEEGPVYLFAAESPVCDKPAALGFGTPNNSFPFAIEIVEVTVPAREPGEYRFMAAQCIGSKVAANASKTFTITPPGTTATNSSGSTATSGSSTTNGGGSPSGGSSSLQPGHASASHFGQFGWLTLAVVAVLLAGVALAFAIRRPAHGGGPPLDVTAAVAYRPAPPPLVHETTPRDRLEIRMHTDERYGPGTSTEEQR